MAKRKRKEEMPTAFLHAFVRSIGCNITATRHWQDVINERFGLVPDAVRDEYNDLLITLETMPREYVQGVIKALLVRYFSVVDLSELNDFAQEVFAILTHAAPDDEELRRTGDAELGIEALRDYFDSCGEDDDEEF